MPDDHEEPEEPAPAEYPYELDLEERRRAWIVKTLCETADGPIFESIVRDASAIEAYLKDGTVSDIAKQKPKLAGVKA